MARKLMSITIRKSKGEEGNGQAAETGKILINHLFPKKAKQKKKQQKKANQKKKNHNPHRTLLLDYSLKYNLTSVIKT